MIVCVGLLMSMCVTLHGSNLTYLPLLGQSVYSGGGLNTIFFVFRGIGTAFLDAVCFLNNSMFIVLKCDCI
jgi:hypothetical protein